MNDQETLAAYHEHLSKMGKWLNDILWLENFDLEDEKEFGKTINNQKIAILACRGSSIEIFERLDSCACIYHTNLYSWCSHLIIRSQKTEENYMTWESKKHETIDDAVIALLKKINEGERHE